MGNFLEVGNGCATENDSRLAGYQAATQAMAQIGEFHPCLALAWVSSGYELTEVIQGIKSTLGDTPLVGCVADHIYFQKAQKDSVAVTIIASPFLEVNIGFGEGITQNWQQAVSVAMGSLELGSMERSGSKLLNRGSIEHTRKSFMLMISPAEVGDATPYLYDVTEAIKSRTKNKCPLIGASSGNPETGSNGPQFVNHNIYSDALILVKFDTNLRFGIASGHGFTPTSKAAIVTKAAEYVIEELNHRPASEVYLELLNLDQSQLQAEGEGIFIKKPFGLCDAFGHYHLIVGNGFTPEGGICCLRRPFTGTTLTIMEYVPDVLHRLDAAIISRARERGTISQPGLVLTFSSILRQELVEPNKYQNGIEEITAGLPRVGFMSYGEQGLTEEGVSAHLNMGVTTLVLADELNLSSVGAMEVDQLYNRLANSASEVKKLYEELSTVHNLATTLNASLCLDDIIDSTVKIVRKLLNADGTALLLLKEVEGTKQIYIAGHSGEEIIPVDVDFNDGMCMNALLEGKGFVVGKSTALEHPVVLCSYVNALSIVGQPIMVQGEKIGLIVAYSESPECFADKDLMYLQTMSYQIGLALKNAYKLQATELKACTDGLTGLFDHNYFLDSLDNLLRAADENDESVALVMIDLDDFKFYNDAFGHSVGDLILRTTAQILRQVTRTGDIIARYGGDEFAVILSNTNREQAQDIAERIRIQIAKITHLMDELCFLKRLTASIGVSTFPEDAKTARDLIDTADKAMYNIKRGEKDRVGDFYSELEEMSSTLDDAEKALFDTIKILVGVLDSRDRYTWEHSRAVAKLSEQIAKELGACEDVVSGVRMAGLLHDIGKIHVKEEILNKRDELSNQEWSFIELHPMVGANLLKPIAGFAPIYPAIYHHHEKYNGTGYPDKLVGKQIPFGARIISVADSFDAMTSNRPYRKALTVQAALNEIVQHRGQHFDPDICDALERVITTGIYKRTPNR